MSYWHFSPFPAPRCCGCCRRAAAALTVMGLLASLGLFLLTVSSRYQPQTQMAFGCMTCSTHCVFVAFQMANRPVSLMWKPWKWSHSLSLCKKTRQSWAKWNRFLLMKPQTVKCKNNLCHMCKASGGWGVSPQLYTLRAVPFTQEEKCHCINMCICAVLPACTHTALLLQGGFAEVLMLLTPPSGFTYILDIWI